MRDPEEVAEAFYKIIGPFLLFAGPFGFFSTLYFELSADRPIKMRGFVIGLSFCAFSGVLGYAICRYVGFIRPRKK